MNRQRVGPDGPWDSKIMVVGEAPGAEEDRLGKPFQGPSGKLLRGMLLNAGINPDQVFYTNLCRYKPPGNDIKAFFDSAGRPGPVALEGLGELKDEIEAVNPNVILALGNYPMKMLTGKGNWNKKESSWAGIGDWRGSILDGSGLTGGRKIIPTFHPAYLLRDYSSKAIGLMDLIRAKDQMAFPEIRRPTKILAIDPEGEERQWWRDRLLNDPTATLTFDIEYIGSNLLCVGMTTSADEACVIHTQSKADVDFVRTILCSGIDLCAQNGMFDCSILEWFYDMPLMRHLVYDTMIAAHASYIEFPKGLDFLTSIYTEQPYYKDMISWKAVAAGTQPISDVLHYNAIDTWCTHAIMEGQKAEDLTDPNVRGTFEHEMSLIYPLWTISKRGVKIDVEGLATLRSTLETETSVLLAGLQVLAGKSINIKSGPQVASLLFKDLGLPVVDKTPKGAPKTNDDTLAALALKATDPRHLNIIKCIRDARERVDLMSKFCDIELDEDGRMRCHYDPAKTDTGRLSSRKFYPTNHGSNLQNVPRDPRVRAVFVPDSGMVFGYADLMQAESLVVAHVSGDPEMLRLHHTPGIDGHKYVASYIFDKPMEAISKDERFIGKKIRHACNYAMGWHRLMQVINADATKTGVSITAAQSKIYVDKYRKLHHYLPAWWREIESDLWSSRTLYTLLGRKRVFYDRIDSNLPAAIAYIPQGTVGDTLNVGLRRCFESEELRALGFEMLLQVHDAIGYQCPKENVSSVNRLVRDLMAVPLYVKKRDESFTIPVEIQVGANWGESSKDNPDGLKAWHADAVVDA